MKKLFIQFHIRVYNQMLDKVISERILVLEIFRIISACMHKPRLRKQKTCTPIDLIFASLIESALDEFLGGLGEKGMCICFSLMRTWNNKR